MQNENDGRNDFDFFIGRWKAHSRRLRERLKGSNDWDEFEGVAAIRKVLGGMGNIDEIRLDRELGSLEGLTLRLYNPESRQWSMYWASNTDGILQSPVIGSFAQGRGEFYSQEFFEGRSIFCRFVCSNITGTSCRWEQAFSTDGGKTWETNWIADLTRLNE
jgi:hypothetical protein